MKKNVKTYQGVLLFVLLAFQLFSQNPAEIGAQWIFSSENDSIQISSLSENHRNYIILFYGAWSNQSNEQLALFEAKMNVWKDQHNLDIIVINDFYATSIEDGLNEMLNYPFQKWVSKNIRNELDILKFPNAFFYVNNQLISQFESLKSVDEWEQIFNKYIKHELHENIQTSTEQLVSFAINCEGQLFDVLLEPKDSTEIIYKLTAFFENYRLRESTYFERVEISAPNSPFFFDLLVFDAEICQSIKIYSILSDKVIDVEVTDVFTQDGRRHVKTNMPFLNCPDHPEYLTFISGIGSNAGLVPVFNDSYVFSKLLCATVDEEQVFTFNNDPNNCNLSYHEDSITTSEDFQIFPNPTSHQIEIQGLDTTIDHIEIRNLEGKSCKIINGDQRFIELKDLSPGIYILTLSFENKTVHKKFIKH